jgi:hypothetical protein
MRHACSFAAFALPTWVLPAFALLLTATSAPAGGLFFKKAVSAPRPDTALPLDAMEESQRALAHAVLDRPTLAARGPTETFTCNPEHYYYFLEHPDAAVTAWRKLGAKCVSITARGDGQFGWSDDSGSDLVWQTLHRGGGMRIWFAEGKVRPTPLLPLVPVKALVVMHHGEAKNAEGVKVIEHHADLFVQTDSKTAAAFTKMMGQQAPKLAEQGLGQLQLFFSGLSWYLQRHPEQVKVLMKGIE